VKRSDEYKKYKKDFLKNQTAVFNPVEDHNGQLIGYTVRYEIKYNETKPSSKNQVALNYNSLLTFYYDFQLGKLGVIIVDYSQMAKDKVVYVRDLDSAKVEKVDVSANRRLTGFVKNTKTKAKIELNSVKKGNQLYSDISPKGTHPAMCWICSKYKKGGGTHDGECERLLGAACYIGAKTIWGKLICAGGTVVGCYVPKYKICVAGSWHQCPLP
jgi:hypothetical protein